MQGLARLDLVELSLQWRLRHHEEWAPEGVQELAEDLRVRSPWRGPPPEVVERPGPEVIVADPGLEPMHGTRTRREP